MAPKPGILMAASAMPGGSDSFRFSMIYTEIATKSPR
jgi:hypothetical protein